METKQQTAERLGMTTEGLAADVERLKSEAVARFEAAISETYAAAIDLGTIRGHEADHDHDDATTETILDAIEALMSAIFAGTGTRLAVARVEQHEDGWDYTGPARFIEADGAVAGYTIAEGGGWRAFGGVAPMFTRDDDAPTVEAQS
jgi:hypothetical protein